MKSLTKVIPIFFLCHSMSLFAENEVRYESEYGSATLPHVVVPDFIKGEAGAKHYAIELTKKPDGDFFISNSRETSALSIDDIHGQVTIKSGFYGKVSVSTLLKETLNHPRILVTWPKTEVLVYAYTEPETTSSTNSSSLPSSDSVPIASTFSDYTGYYQIELEAGTYLLCFKPSEQTKGHCDVSYVNHILGNPDEDVSRGPIQECYFEGKFDENDESGELEGELVCAIP